MHLATPLVDEWFQLFDLDVIQILLFLHDFGLMMETGSGC